jgi:hypothetical protein
MRHHLEPQEPAPCTSLPLPLVLHALGSRGRYRVLWHICMQGGGTDTVDCGKTFPWPIEIIHKALFIISPFQYYNEVSHHTIEPSLYPFTGYNADRVFQLGHYFVKVTSEKGPSMVTHAYHPSTQEAKKKKKISLSSPIILFFWWEWDLDSRPHTCWASTLQLSCVGYFWDRISCTICLSWFRTTILLISAFLSS